MAIRDLVPRWRRNDVITRPQGDLLSDFRQEVDRLFDDFFGAFNDRLPASSPFGSFRAAWPRVNVAESEKKIVVTAEIPGVEEGDVRVELDGDCLCLSGEVKDEQEQKDHQWMRVERTTGQFSRVIQLPAEVVGDRADATFKRGVLTITLPKASPSVERRKAIPIKT